MLQTLPTQTKYSNTPLVRLSQRFYFKESCALVKPTDLNLQDTLRSYVKKEKKRKSIFLQKKQDYPKNFKSTEKQIPVQQTNASLPHFQTKAGSIQIPLQESESYVYFRGLQKINPDILKHI